MQLVFEILNIRQINSTQQFRSQPKILGVKEYAGAKSLTSCKQPYFYFGAASQTTNC